MPVTFWWQAVNRADLSWALNAVLPHAGTTKGNYVGLEARAGLLYVYATDDYTSAVARISLTEKLGFEQVFLSKTEATDLMRFVRPTKKAHDTEVVRTRLFSSELHVATDDDSAVFDTVLPDLTLDMLLKLFSSIAARPALRDDIILSPSLTAKYAKAQRYDTDRLRIYPYHGVNIRGVALLTVGADFIGAVAGMRIEDNPPDTLASFLTPREEAAS
jgi:hypothetical protein